MTVNELISKTQSYARSKTGGTFNSITILGFLNEAIDQLKSNIVFNNMPYITVNTAVYFVPSSYHYILALYAASRCFEMDERFFEGTQKRNEFEFKLEELISRINMGDLIIYNELGAVVTDRTNVIDYVVDDYFNTTSTDTEVVI